MKRRTARAQQRISKKKSSRQGGKSKYARKREWCARNGVFGFEILEPKPWK
jgi:hypothetical protein